MATYTRAGIKRLVIYKDTEVEANMNLIDLNIRTDGKLTIEDQGIEDVRGRELPISTKFTVEATTQMIGRPLYYYLLNHAGTNTVAVEAVLTPASTGVLQITGSNFLGIDFEYSITGKERNAKVTLEGSFEKATSEAIINNFVTATPMTSASLGLGSSYGFDTNLYQSPAFSASAYSTDGTTYTALFDAEEIKERTFTAKTVSRKNVYDKSLVDYVEVVCEYTIHNASATKVKALHDIHKTHFAPALKVVEKNSTGTENHNFALGVLSLKNMSEFGETDRFLKLTFKGKIPLDQITYTQGTNTYAYTL